MPTRIALQAPPAASSRNRTARRLPRNSPIFERTTTVDNNNNNDHEIDDDDDEPPAPSPIRTRRSHTSFRSSFLRDLTTSKGDAEEPILERLSSDDIRASPRILGYLLCMIAGAVMLASVVQFYREQKLVVMDNNQSNITGSSIGDSLRDSEFFISKTGLVYTWKLWWTIYIAAAGTALSLVIVLVHFDTVCLPMVWKGVFQDGSIAERNLIFFLLLFWSAAVYICTSPLSVGESQANTFFTAWIALWSIALNYGVWRESAGLTSLTGSWSSNSRETTINWIWTCFFSVVFAGSATDIYRHREEIVLRLRDEILLLDRPDWIVVLSVVWSEVAVCVVSILFNEVLFSGPYWKLCRFRSRTCIFGWPQIEGPIILIAIGAKLWVILKYTGVNGVVNGLSNAYFAIWGTFLSSVFCLGTWLRENRNIDYIITDNEAEASDRPDSRRG